MKIKFVKVQDQWFADLPEYIESGGSYADCAMVAGADSWLDIIAQGENEVELELSNSNSNLRERITRVNYNPEDLGEGATYVAFSFSGIPYQLELWLCPVTLFVFNEYPEQIFYQKIK